MLARRDGIAYRVKITKLKVWSDGVLALKVANP